MRLILSLLLLATSMVAQPVSVSLWNATEVSSPTPGYFNESAPIGSAFWCVGCGAGVKVSNSPVVLLKGSGVGLYFQHGVRFEIWVDGPGSTNGTCGKTATKCVTDTPCVVKFFIKIAWQAGFMNRAVTHTNTGLGYKPQTHPNGVTLGPFTCAPTSCGGSCAPESFTFWDTTNWPIAPLAGGLSARGKCPSCDKIVIPADV